MRRSQKRKCMLGIVFTGCFFSGILNDICAQEKSTEEKIKRYETQRKMFENEYRNQGVKVFEHYDSYNCRDRTFYRNRKDSNQFYVICWSFEPFVKTGGISFEGSYDRNEKYHVVYYVFDHEARDIRARRGAKNKSIFEMPDEFFPMGDLERRDELRKKLVPGTQYRENIRSQRNNCYYREPRPTVYCLIIHKCSRLMLKAFYWDNIIIPLGRKITNLAEQEKEKQQESGEQQEQQERQKRKERQEKEKQSSINKTNNEEETVDDDTLSYSALSQKISSKIRTTPHDLSSDSDNPDFILSCSSPLNGRHAAFHAMNGNIQEGNEFHTKNECDPFWMIRFKGEPVTLKSFWIKNRILNISNPRCPVVFVRDLRLLGSSDGLVWEELKDFSLNDIEGAVTNVPLNLSEVYSYYKIVPQVRKYKDNYLVIGEIEIQYVQKTARPRAKYQKRKNK